MSIRDKAGFVMFELHYGTGGHGGPYHSLADALERAKAMLLGSRSEHHVYVRRGVSGPLVAVVSLADASEPRQAAVRFVTTSEQARADAMADAETLRNVVSTHGMANRAVARGVCEAEAAGHRAIQWRCGYGDGLTFYAEEAARAAFRAVPGLRG